MNRLAALAVPAAILTLALGGCGSKEDGAALPAQNQPAGSQSTGAQPTGTQSTGAAATQEDTSAAADVKITKCVNKSYIQEVTIEVTNSTPAPQRYVVGVNVTDTSGGKSEARFVKNRMEPGQKITEMIPGDTPLKGEVTCAIGEAKRLAPK